MSYDRESIENKVTDSINKLMDFDGFLLEKDAHEVSIAHRLACYLQELFIDLKVDIEYNRRWDGDKKRLDVNRNVRLKNPYVRPDVIIHSRGDDDSNILIIEIKKLNQNDIPFAEEKLKKFTSIHEKEVKSTEYKFLFGLLIVFDLESNPKNFPKLKWFSEGKS